MDVQRENTYIRTYGRTHIHEHIYIPARICPYKNLKEGDETTVYLLCKCTAHVLRLLLLMCSLLSYRKLQEGDEIVSVNGCPINGRTPSDLKVHVVGPSGTSVSLGVRKKSTGLLSEVLLTRGPTPPEHKVLLHQKPHLSPVHTHTHTHTHS